MTKLKAGRLARIVTDSCLQFWGGNGFTWENPVCRMHRDLRLHSVGAGADEVMLSIICKQMGIAPQRHRIFYMMVLYDFKDDYFYSRKRHLRDLCRFIHQK
ncbi:hypothetical protein KIN20_012116 [Parelaphostrongylus tenuis]|uniref:Acyl-CoA dehydrogenase/oxidase C-terminal domain-containing protein n=1 Tax=Parelaphostrongylus tenuis TaxID=148309 RepID=A0AAD5MVY6_PARTN|nr:hypothetical protein KIN20_012116 [Parelaphostrongylus tenuis]